MKNVTEEQKIRRSLNRDLIADILSRLPAQRLLDWRLASKQWCSLIDNEIPHPLAFVFLYPGRPPPSTFIAAHMTHKNGEGKLARLFIALHHGRSLGLSRFTNTDRPIDLIASCNGLFLYCCRTTKPWYTVCNPATKKTVFLPDPPCGDPSSNVALLAFDPRNSPHYKVVLFGHGVFTVYSSADETWGQLSPFSVEIYRNNNNHRMSLFLNGVLYLYNHDNIVRFDVATESYRVLLLPTDVGERRHGRFLFGLLGGYICCSQLGGLRVWVLQEEKWVLGHFNLEARVKEYTSNRESRILAFHPEYAVILVRKSSLISFYDLKHKRFEHLIVLNYLGMEAIKDSCKQPALSPTVLPFSPCFLDM